MGRKDLNTASYEDQLWYIERYEAAIRYIDFPCGRLQKIAIEKDIFNIKHIDFPTKEVQLYAISKNRWAFRHIDQPCKEAKNLHHYLYEL